MRILSIIFLIALCGCFGPLPAPYNELKTVLPYDEQGWYNNQRPLKKLIAENDVRVVIEIGSWLGASTRDIAKRLPRNGKVYAVDHWLGSAEHQNGDKLPQLYEQFLSNVIHKKLTHKIIPIRLPSIDAEKVLSDVKPDLIYIDGDHTTEAVYQDLTVWYPHVKGHGILCGDDWAWESVKVAVERFATENQLKIEAEGAFWRLIEPIKS